MKLTFICTSKESRFQQNGNGVVAVAVTLVPTGNDIKGGQIVLSADEASLLNIKPGNTYQVVISQVS